MNVSPVIIIVVVMLIDPEGDRERGSDFQATQRESGLGTQASFPVVAFTLSMLTVLLRDACTTNRSVGNPQLALV